MHFTWEPSFRRHLLGPPLTLPLLAASGARRRGPRPGRRWWRRGSPPLLARRLAARDAMAGGDAALGEARRRGLWRRRVKRLLHRRHGGGRIVGILVVLVALGVDRGRRGLPSPLQIAASLAVSGGEWGGMSRWEADGDVGVCLSASNKGGDPLFLFAPRQCPA